MKKKNRDRFNRLTLRLRIKKYKMLASYHISNTVRKFNLAYFLFIINIALVMLVLLPNTAHRLHVPFGIWPIKLELYGKVLIENNASSDTDLAPACFIDIYIGGYHTVTDSNGEFHCIFTSQSFKDIPVVFVLDGEPIIRWVSFEENQFEKQETFILK